MGVPVASCSAMSSGSSISTAPGFSASATLKALRKISGMLFGWCTVCAHLVMGRNMETESMFWWPLLVEALGAGLTDEADQRRAVHVGIGDTRDEIGGAGAEGAEADAGPCP